jgi:hypothetical protein
MDSLDKHRDFVERYDRGTPPYDDISDEEALDRYREAVAGRSEADFLASAQEAFSRMSPEERATFGVQLRDQSDQRDLGFPGQSAQEDRFEDPELLARVTARANREHPELLESLLKGGSAGLVGGTMGDGVTGGEGASGGEGGMTSNPAAKVALVGIAAALVRKGMNGGQSVP